MYASVTRLRVGGRRGSDSNPESSQLEGELTVRPRGAMLVAELRQPLTMSAPPLAVLFDVRLLGIGARDLRLRGFEPYGPAAVLQEWQCELLDVRHGFDAQGRRRLEPLWSS